MLINNNIEFKKSNFKSPIGNGIFDIYINEQSTLLYKKIRNKKFINDIEIYKNIINDVINIGGAQEMTILELANLIIKKTNSSSKKGTKTVKPKTTKPKTTKAKATKAKPKSSK